MTMCYYELPTTTAAPLIKIITGLPFLQKEGEWHKFHVPAVTSLDACPVHALLTCWADEATSSIHMIIQVVLENYYYYYYYYLSTFLMLLHNSHLHVNWGGCYIATGGWQAQPMVCAARGALGVLQWEQQTPSSLPARAACSWSEGWWILRRFGLEAVIPLGVM